MAKSSFIKVEIIGDAASLEKATRDAEKSVGKLDDAVGKVDGKGIGKLDGAIGDLARDRLGPLGGLAQSVGMDLGGMSAATLGAGAAVAGLGAFVASGVRDLGAMTEEVRKFRDSSGLSWETSSRLVATMDDLGVSAETGASAMGRLAKNIDAGALQEFGIQAAYAEDGTVDMAGTLGNVADAMMATTDPTKRATMGTQLFGKSWVDLVPYLELGGKGIRDAMGDVKDYQIASAESAKQQRELSMAVDDMQDAASGLAMTMAQDLIPTLTTLANVGAKSVNAITDVRKWDPINYTMKELFGSGGRLAKSWAFINGESQATIDAMGGASDATGELAETAEEAAEKVKELADREREAARDATEAANATNAYRKAVDELATAAQGSIGNQIGYARAEIAVRDGLEKVTEAQKEAQEAADAYGRKSPEFIKTQKDLESAFLDSIGTMDALAKAEVERRVQQAAGSEGTLTAIEKTQIYGDKIHELGKAISEPNMRKMYDEFIAKSDAAGQKAQIAASGQEAFNTQVSLVGKALASVGSFTDALPTDAQASAFERIAAAARTTASALAELGIDTTPAYLAPGLEPMFPAGRRAHGGPVGAGQTYMVGEQGPELFTSQRSGTIIPNGALSGGATNNITINTAADPNAVVQAVKQFLRMNGSLPW